MLDEVFGEVPTEKSVLSKVTLELPLAAVEEVAIITRFAAPGLPIMTLPEATAVKVNVERFKVPVPVVNEFPFIEVAVATPKDGVINAGDVVSEMAPDPFTFKPRAVSTPVPVVVVVGAVPEPPPIIMAFAVSKAELAHVEVDEKYGIPPDVPATVNAGVVVGVATDIRPPVKPTDVTVPVPAAVHVIAVVPPPCEVNTCPALPAVVGKLKLYVPAAD